jgi:hypothetical protein
MTEIKGDYKLESSYEENLDYLLKDIRNMLIKKHHDYGVDNLKKHGLIGINVRLDDKMARLNNFFENTCEYKVETETAKDTYKDVAGYALQAILMLEEKL